MRERSRGMRGWSRGIRERKREVKRDEKEVRGMRRRLRGIRVLCRHPWCRCDKFATISKSRCNLLAPPDTSTPSFPNLDIA